LSKTSRPGALSRKRTSRIRRPRQGLVASVGRDSRRGSDQARQQAWQTNFSHPADGNCTTRIRRIKRCPRFQIAKLIILFLKKLKKSALLKKISRNQVSCSPHDNAFLLLLSRSISTAESTDNKKAPTAKVPDDPRDHDGGAPPECKVNCNFIFRKQYHAQSDLCHGSRTEPSA
jgi:hypothetical protein